MTLRQLLNRRRRVEREAPALPVQPPPTYAADSALARQIAAEQSKSAARRRP